MPPKKTPFQLYKFNFNPLLFVTKIINYSV